MPRAVAKVRTTPSPNGGFNARDGLGNMPETDAVELINWVPDAGGLRSRRGYIEWATGLGIAVGSIMSRFAPVDAFPGGSFLSLPTAMPGKLFAATDVGIYDITASGVVGAAVQALSGVTNAGWFSSVQITNAGGTFLLACSEVDGYFVYDGATWNKVLLGGGGSQVSVSDPKNFVHVVNWKRRAWFTVRNSTKAAYLAADAIYGAAAEFDFGPVFRRGGHLAFLANWTIDAGEGVDDLLVAVSSNGDVAVYRGTDPASSATFALVGVWFVGQIPVGRRCYTQFGGDLIIAGADGIYPVSYITRGGAEFLVASSKEYSSKIRSAIGQDLKSSFTLYGWQMLIHPTERVLIASVPNYSIISSRQWAMSTTMNEWCKFVGIPIYCMGMTGGYAFAGDTEGTVHLILATDYDAMALGESVGSYIEGRVIPAFSTFQTPAVNKELRGVRPTFVSVQPVGFSVESCINFTTRVPSTAANPTSGIGSLWNAENWNAAVWGGAATAFADWVTVDSTPFYAATAVIDTLTVGSATMVGVDYLYEPGNTVWA